MRDVVLTCYVGAIGQGDTDVVREVCVDGGQDCHVGGDVADAAEEVDC